MRETHDHGWPVMARKRNDAPMTFATALRIRMDRETPPLSQDDAAGELEVSQSQVGRWLSGVQLPRAEKYPSLMGFLEVTEEELALLVHRGRRLSTPERLDALEDRLSQIEAALGLDG